MEFLISGSLLENKEVVRKLKYRMAMFYLINWVLYRHNFSLLYLQCLHDDDVDYVVREIHMGNCENHSKGRALAYKALRQGYYWPTKHKDSKAMARACLACQK